MAQDSGVVLQSTINSLIADSLSVEPRHVT